MADRVSKKVKGGRKAFFEHAETDMLLSMLLSLMAEHSIVKERLAKLEAFLWDKGLLDMDELSSFAPDAETSDRLDAERMQMIKNVLESGRNIGNKAGE